MELRVDPAAVDGYGDMVTRASNNADDCRRYLARCPQVSLANHGIITKLSWAHPEVIRTVDGVFRHLTNILDSSGGELHNAAQKYRTTEAGLAKTIDASIPPTERPTLRDPGDDTPPVNPIESGPYG